MKRAPVFGAGSITISRPLFSSASRTAQITGTFYKRGGVLLPNVQVFLVQGFGTAARNIHAGGAFGGTFTTNAAGVVAFNRTVALASLTQPLFFSFIPADPAWAYGGRDQLFRGDYGDYWFAPTFAVLLAKIPNEFTAGYLFVPSTTAFAVVSARSALLPPAGSTTATVRVTGGTGLPMANATVWSGPVSNITDANGIATLPFSATTLGANEQLVVVRTTDGQVLRAWYGVVVTYPVLAVQSVTVDPKQAGSASTITVNVQNTLAVAGPATVTISVDGTVVSAKVINIGASATQAVTFSYVFDSAKSYTVASADKSATANVPAAPAPPGPDLGVAIGLGVGLLIVGLVVGAGLGMVMKGRRKPPAEASSTESPMAEEEIRDSGDTEQR
ncbi:MAG: hypothetical protein E6K18_04855 [Methanobacteriota archaeon]|nr:MAG: hypothetical protein E6K18_04855 [Euryarchaeota archaeon]